MRWILVAPLLVATVAACAPPTPKGEDLTIDVFLAMDDNKCVVRFSDVGLKNADRAIAWTNHKVTWQVVRNDCGEKTKIDKKALGLKHLKAKSTGHAAAWECTKLDRVPARGTVEFHCQIPSSSAGGWERTRTDEVKVYEYEIDGDSVEPVDPDIGVKKNG
jgi:hypothetical protein